MLYPGTAFRRMGMNMNRREFLFLLIIAAATGCQRRFVRPGGEHQLGELKDLLRKRTVLRESGFLVFRDDQGWSVISSLCTYDGCNLTYQGKGFLCSCCGSRFTEQGGVLNGPTQEVLPWFEIHFADNRLFTDSAKIVDQNYRFTNAEVETIVSQLMSQGATTDEAPKVPEVLLGDGGSSR